MTNLRRQTPILTFVQSFLAIYILLITIRPGSQAQQLKYPASPCPNAFKIDTNYQFRGSLHFICLQPTTSQPRLNIIHYLSQQVIATKLLGVDDFGTDLLTNFVDDEGTLRILLAVPSRVNGTSVYSIDASGNFLEETHTINTQFVTAMRTWRLQLNWEWHLAIANQPTYEILINDKAPQRIPLPNPKPMITIHSWKPSYFDSYKTIYIPDDGHVNKLEPLNINGQEFLIVAVGPHKADRTINNLDQVHSPDSMIYRLDFGDGALEWIEFQRLKTKTALDIKPFVITHQGSLQKDYYIALLGQVKSNLYEHHVYNHDRFNQTDAHNSQYGLIIYKYFGDQFMNTNSISIPGATKLDAISYGIGDSYVVIAILSGWSGQINLYLYDGLNLRPLSSPYNAISPQSKSSRFQRSMAQSDLHLFLVPPVLVPENEDSLNKRTLTNSIQALGLPALAFSTFSTENINGSEFDSQPGSIYHIPISSITNDSLAPQGDSYSKRNYVGVGEDLLGWCKSTINRLLTDNFELAARQLLKLPRVNQKKPIELVGDLIIEDDLYVSNLLYVNQFKTTDRNESENILIDVPASNYSYTFDRIQVTHLEIDAVKRRVDQILVDDGSNQDIFNTLRFDTLIIDCLNSNNPDPRFLIPFAGFACPQIDEIRTTFLNNRDISSIQKQALLTGRSMVIARDVRFEHLVLRGTTDILGTLNGINIGEIVFKRGPSTGSIHGHKHFRGGLFSSSNIIANFWNLQSVDRLNFLTSLEAQRIEANLRFSQVILDTSSEQILQNITSRIEKLNNLHVDTHLDQIVLADSPSNIEVPVQFDELILNGHIQFTENSHLSSINLEDLWTNALFKHSVQNITAPMEFVGDVHISYGGDIVVEGLINGIPLDPNTILMRNRDTSISRPVVFERNLNARSILLEKALNGVDVVLNPTTGTPELGILLNGGTQWITADKILNEIHLSGNSTIHGNINGRLNLTQLYHLANNNGEPYKFATIRLSGRDVRLADQASIHIDSSINGHPAQDICSLAIKVAQSPQTQYSRLKFEQPISFKSLRCGAINGFNNLSNYFLTKYGHQHVAGTLRLTNGVLFNTSINIRSSLNNLNVEPLARSIAQIINETRTGHKDHYGDLIVDELVTPRINDLSLSSVFITKSDTSQVVRAPMIFDHLDIENIVIIGENFATRSFNGLNVTDILSNTLQYDVPQRIYNHIETQTLQLLPNSNFITSSINGFDLRKLYADAVLVDVPQQIVAPKTFRAPVEFTNRVFLGQSIDGLTGEELRFNLLLHSDELIDGDLEFDNDIFIRNELEIQSGMINDIDVNIFVDSMLYENHPNRSGLRILGNGTVIFKDVKVNNLVVAGTIQGIDLSRQALTRNDNVNGSYDSKIREQQIINNNRRLINSMYGPGSSFRVSSNYRGEYHVGNCYVHSCARKIPLPPPRPASQPVQARLLQPHLAPPTPAPPVSSATPPMYSSVYTVYPATPPESLPLINQALPQPIAYGIPQVVQEHELTYFMQPPTRYIQQFYPNVMPNRLPSINTSVFDSVWKPNWDLVRYPYPTPSHLNNTMYANFVNQQPSIENAALVQYNSVLQTQEINELALRVNKYLSISFYYDIVQKHPLMGPLLHAAKNPILNEQNGSLLLLKSTSMKGEPCLQIGQTIGVMAQQRQRNNVSIFTQNSVIQGTSNPIMVDSVVTGKNHYLFVLDSSPEVLSTTYNSIAQMISRVLVYHWDYRSGRYELREKIMADGRPIAIKAFTTSSFACFALVDPIIKYGNFSGFPVLHCQQPGSLAFDNKIIVEIQNVFDLDIVTVPAREQIIIASLSQQFTGQLGDLSVNAFDILTKSMSNIAYYPMIKPLKLHFFDSGWNYLQLAISETITSNDIAEAITRIFSLRVGVTPDGFINIRNTHFYETQLIRDNQFYDIQSVSLDGFHTLLFFQSFNSISIFAPIPSLEINENVECDKQYSLIQRLPTKGANKFVVFKDRLNNSTNNKVPYDHYLVLSKDDCQHQQYTTLILKTRYK